MILLVEDGPTEANVAQRLLKKAGPVRVVGSVAEAVRVLDLEDGIGGLIVDIGLPDGSGFDVVDTARALYTDLPCLVLTGNDDHDVIRRAQLYGCEYLPKPASGPHLVAFAKRCRARPHWRHARLAPIVRDFAEEHRLSAREEEIVRLIARDVSPGDLPREMGVSENTIKTLTRRLLNKCGASRLDDVLERLRKRISIPPRSESGTGLAPQSLP